MVSSEKARKSQLICSCFFFCLEGWEGRGGYALCKHMDDVSFPEHPQCERTMVGI